MRGRKMRMRDWFRTPITAAREEARQKVWTHGESKLSRAFDAGGSWKSQWGRSETWWMDVMFSGGRLLGV
jgi:hypothetical protein